jgi:hypothetical protein
MGIVLFLFHPTLLVHFVSCLVVHYQIFNPCLTSRKVSSFVRLIKLTTSLGMVMRLCQFSSV